MTVCIVKGSLCLDVINKIHSGTLQLRTKSAASLGAADNKSFRSLDCVEEIYALGTTGTRVSVLRIPTCLARNCFNR